MGSDLFSAHHRESWCLCQQFRESAGYLDVGYNNKHKTQRSSPTPLWSVEKACSDAEGSCTIRLTSPSPFHLLLTDLDVTWELSLLRLCSPEAELPLGNWAVDLSCSRGKERKKKKGISQTEYLAYNICADERISWVEHKKHWSDIRLQNRAPWSRA